MYRAEYLAGEVLAAAEEGHDGLDLNSLRQLLSDREALTRRIRDFAAPRYREGYEKGIHDHDAALILARLLPLRDSAGLLSHTPLARGIAAFSGTAFKVKLAHWSGPNAPEPVDIFSSCLVAAMGSINWKRRLLRPLTVIRPTKEWRFVPGWR